MKEIEAKILEVDLPALRQRLEELGALQEFEMEFIAVYFKDPNNTMEEKGESLRLRKEGEQAVLTFKRPLENESEHLKIREEVETKVDDLKATRRILELLGYQARLQLRKTRTQFKLGKVHLVLDKYHDEQAHIPAFLEIEAPSEDTLHATAARLGYSSTQLLPWSVKELLAHYG